MYQVMDESNDYAIDSPPAGFEIEEENIPIFQSLDESSDIPEVVKVLEQSLNDYERLYSTNAAVLESISSGDSLKRSEAIHGSVKLRGELEKRYGGNTQRFATESYHIQGIVLLEADQEEKAKEETDKNKGFFTRIIDAIVKAFNWLWDKITKLFSSEDDSEEKLDKVKQKLEASAKNKTEPEKTLVNVTGFDKLFPELSGEVKYSDVIDLLKKSTDNAAKLAKMKLFVGVALVMICAASESEKKSKEGLRDIFQRMNIDLASFVTSLDKIKKTDVTNRGIDLPDAPEDLYGLEGFIKSSGIYIWVEGDICVRPKSVFASVKKDKGDKTYPVPSIEEGLMIISANEILIKATKNQFDDFRKIANTQKQITNGRLKSSLESLQSSLQSAPEEQKKELMEFIKEINQYATSIGSFTSNMVKALLYVRETEKFAFKYCDSVLASYEKKPETDNKSKVDETK